MYSYSVIVPHYNSLDTLGRAIASVPRRPDIQLIVVDNSPTPIDRKEVTAFYPEGEVLYSDNSRRAGGARNEGIKAAEGKYILFLDADDFFLEEAFDVFDSYLKTDYDIVYFDVTGAFSDTLKPSNRCVQTNQLISRAIKHSDMDLLRYNYVSPWCKMFKREFLIGKGILFPKELLSEDIIFSVTTGFFARNVTVDERKCYCVTVRKGSLVRTKNKETSMVEYKMACRKNAFLLEHGKGKYQERVFTRVVNSLKYGQPEFTKYIKIAREYNINTFWGIGNLVKSFFTGDRIQDDGKTYNVTGGGILTVKSLELRVDSSFKFQVTIFKSNYELRTENRELRVLHTAKERRLAA